MRSAFPVQIQTSTICRRYGTLSIHLSTPPCANRLKNTQPRMKLSDHIKNEELVRLESAWRRLTWWQKQSIVLPLKIERLLHALSTVPYYLLQQHITRRRTRFASVTPG